MTTVLIGLICFGVGALVGVFIKHFAKCLCC